MLFPNHSEGGILGGYPVMDIKFTLIDGSYHDVDSSELSFKVAAEMAVKEGKVLSLNFIESGQQVPDREIFLFFTPYIQNHTTHVKHNQSVAENQSLIHIVGHHQGSQSQILDNTSG